MRSETDIALAVMGAALNGDTDPLGTVETSTGYGERRIQRAWSNWKQLRIDELEALAAMEHPQFSEAARTAIVILERHDTK